ncbi:hypothetical protein GGE16_005364 [Rhizobium leguminosarum]|uniref:Uncharacterized protein n=1 Tax=Rhizobium leguminosarum TaxID=384 RepID=A0AAE2SYQ4_RHILE|nr:hypothetical protein [Rhizobium leguminosarum]MBB4435502.1 hypothetical protein [Rhizobium esperanzae]MBB4296114.1 hypothetical protein [Rhizobium leguminosarum]MBB4311461.1 hypothetical protein [Rhizobium leguminosarum]MBB4420343.1 hypothetical protein [Rhizobium leguminosarum]
MLCRTVRTGQSLCKKSVRHSIIGVTSAPGVLSCKIVPVSKKPIRKPVSAMQGLPLVRIPAEAFTSAAGDIIHAPCEINAAAWRESALFENLADQGLIRSIAF